MVFSFSHERRDAQIHPHPRFEYGASSNPLPPATFA